MKKIIIVPNRAFLFLFALYVFSGCTTEIVDFSKTCSLKGKVVACDEFGIENQDNSNISVTIENTSFSTKTDESGLFVFDSVPNGTYTLVLEKEGYGTRNVGANVFSYIDTITVKPTELFHISSIEIKNFGIEQEGSRLYAKGTIIHKFPQIQEGMVKCPRIQVYFSNKNNVSDQNFINGYTHDVVSPTNSEFRIELNHTIWAPYNKGDTYYYIAYGSSVAYCGYNNFSYDPKTAKGVSSYPLLGKPSNIFAFTKEN